MKNCKKIPDHVRSLLERAIALPLPPGWAEVLAAVLTTGAMPPLTAYDGLSIYTQGCVQFVPKRLYTVLFNAARYKDPWNTTTVGRNLRALQNSITSAENESQNP